MIMRRNRIHFQEIFDSEYYDLKSLEAAASVFIENFNYLRTEHLYSSYSGKHVALH